jgi:hypothetical protein
MSYAFNISQPTNSAREAFGVFNESQYAGEYILNKKAKATFCKPNICKGNKKVGTQGQLLLLNKSNMLKFYSESYNPSQLNSNLVTKLDLTGVTVMETFTNPPITPAPIQHPPYISPNYPYLDYIIDPNGSLFGNTPCGVYNFLNYRVYNPPYNNPNPGHINNL